MCEFYESYDKEEFIGYKVAAKMDNSYYSIAMGFLYPQNGDVPIPIQQKKLSSHFNDYILLYGSSGYERQMEGRTAAFISLGDAMSLRTRIAYTDDIFDKYKIVVLKIKLTKDLLKGKYGFKEIVGGKHMEILEEVEFKTY